jgi:SAM-dependent methyltransferase
MKITTKIYDDLLKLDLSTYKKEIKPLTNYNGGEYNSMVANYSKENIAVTNRLITPYITSQTHGIKIYDGLDLLLEDLSPTNVLDLGCAAGELLFQIKRRIPSIETYGITIHVGEVLAAKSLYGIEIVPADMREVEDLFEKETLDLVITHCSIHFLDNEDRIILAQNIAKVLKQHKYFLLVEYIRGTENNGLPYDIPQLKRIREYPNFMGKAILYQKI